MLLDPKEFSEQVREVSKQSLAEYGKVHAHLFMVKVGKPMVSINVSEFMKNEQTKNILAFLPAYFGLLNDGVDFVALTSEVWSADSEAIEAKYGKEKASQSDFIQSLIQQYGAVSQLPEDLRSEQVMANIQIGGNSHMLLLPIVRDEHNHPSLSGDEISLSDCVSSGRLAELTKNYERLKETIDNVAEKMREGEGESFEMPSLCAIAAMLDQVECSNRHASAFEIANKIMGSIDHSLKTPTSLQGSDLLQ